MPNHIGPAPAYHVMCLLLVLVARPTNQDRCGDHVVCPGGRPPLPIGCCPVEAGQVCRPSNNESCDTELGFQCLSENGGRVTDGSGICKGSFNLTVTSVGQNQLDLSWSNFAPEDYLYEYILQFRANTYNYDLNRWNHKECGAEPRYRLKGLVPNTPYYIRVSIWENDSPWTIGNTTETIRVTTRPVDYCSHLDREYSVGETFVHECEDNCTCMGDGEIACEQLCHHEGVPEIEEGCRLVEGDECCDFQVYCPVGGEPCMLNGTSHRHGSVIEDGCRECECMHGQWECIYPHTCESMESSPSCPIPRSRQVAGQCCPEWYCDETCHYENRTFSHLEYFTSAHCGLCQCDVSRGVQCAPDCPPVSLVLPEAACPDPHIRRDGCCPTLHCWDPTLDPGIMAARIFALSYSPASWTISFEVEPVEVHNEIPLFCEYEITYSNSTDPSAHWFRHVVQPVDIRVNRDQSYPVSADPSQVLTTESAVVVGDRAYLTLAGMYPNTTYYVRIRTLTAGRRGYVVVEEEEGVAGGGNDGDGLGPARNNSSLPRAAAMVVVKTLPLNNVTSCFHGGQEVLHGSQVESHCSKRCRCVLGEIRCSTACEDEMVVIAASASCPSPRLERVEGQCCPSWSCYPSGSGCLHNHLILESGRSITEGCSLCTCHNGTVDCVSVCPPTGQSPRPDCQLTNITGHCCLQWMCPLESQPARGAEGGMIVLFPTRCPSSNPQPFKKDLGASAWTHLTNQIDATSTPQLVTFRDNMRVDVHCPNGTHQRATRSLYWRDVNQRGAVVAFRVQTNFSAPSAKEEDLHNLREALTQLHDILSKGVHVTLATGDVLASSDTKKMPLAFTCEAGFAYTKGSCVLSEIRTSPSFLQLSPLQVTHVTDSLATVQWDSLDQLATRHVTGIEIQFRLSTSPEWSRAAKILPHVTSYTLTNLKSDRAYIIRLVAVTSWAGRNKWTIGETRLETKYLTIGIVTANMTATIVLQDPWISQNSALFYWDPPPEDVASLIKAVHVIFKPQTSRVFTNRAPLPNPRQTHMQLNDLESGTPYVAKLVMHMATGQAFESKEKQFVTTSTVSNKTTLILIIAGSCILVFGIIVTIAFVQQRRARKKHANTGFENMTYGLPMENNVEPAQAVNPSSN